MLLKTQFTLPYIMLMVVDEYYPLIYKEVVHKEKSKSHEDAIMYMYEIGLSTGNNGRIGILTDTLHGRQRNVKDRNVICQMSHNVIKDMYTHDEILLCRNSTKNYEPLN